MFDFGFFFFGLTGLVLITLATLSILVMAPVLFPSSQVTTSQAPRQSYRRKYGRRLLLVIDLGGCFGRTPVARVDDIPNQMLCAGFSQYLWLGRLQGLPCFQICLVSSLAATGKSFWVVILLSHFPLRPLPPCFPAFVSLHDLHSGLLLAAAAAMSPKFVSLHDLHCGLLLAAALSFKLVFLHGLHSGLLLAAAAALSPFMIAAIKHPKVRLKAGAPVCHSGSVKALRYSVHWKPFLQLPLALLRPLCAWHTLQLSLAPAPMQHDTASQREQARE